VINGRKSYITNAGVADVLGFLSKSDGVSALFSWRRAHQGLRSPEENHVPDSAPSDKRAGLHRLPSPLGNLIGQEGRGMAAALPRYRPLGERELLVWHWERRKGPTTER